MQGERKTLEHSALKRMSPSNFSPQGCGKRKEYKSQREWKTPRKQDFLNTTGLTHIWTHRDGSHRHKVCTGRVIEVKAEVDTWVFSSDVIQSCGGKKHLLREHKYLDPSHPKHSQFTLLYCPTLHHLDPTFSNCVTNQCRGHIKELKVAKQMWQ